MSENSKRVRVVLQAQQVKVLKLAVLRQAILAFKTVHGSLSPDGAFEFVRRSVGSVRYEDSYRVPKNRLAASDHSPC